MTASDARPPSDTDDEVCGACGAPLDASGDCSVVGNRRHARPPSDTEATGTPTARTCDHTDFITEQNGMWNQDVCLDCQTIGPRYPIEDGLHDMTGTGQWRM